MVMEGGWSSICFCFIYCQWFFSPANAPNTDITKDVVCVILSVGWYILKTC